MASEIPALRYRWCIIGAQILPQAGIFPLIREAVAYRVLNLMLAICGAISRCTICRFGGESGDVTAGEAACRAQGDAGACAGAVTSAAGRTA